VLFNALKIDIKSIGNNFDLKFSVCDFISLFKTNVEIKYWTYSKAKEMNSLNVENYFLG